MGADPVDAGALAITSPGVEPADWTGVPAGRALSAAGPGATVAPDGDESGPGGLLSGDPAERRIMLAGSELDGGADPTPAADVEAGTVEVEMAEAGPAA